LRRVWKLAGVVFLVVAQQVCAPDRRGRRQRSRPGGLRTRPLRWNSAAVADEPRARRTSLM